MKQGNRSSSFQSLVLEIIQNKLNMMVTECFQLKKAVDYGDYEKLTKIILREIANGHIQSAHMSSDDAQNAMKMLDGLEENRKAVNSSGTTGPGPSQNGGETSPPTPNPFADSPFN
ncbi:MAG: hypothetical protein J0L75_09020 [Spirochaetes bacterium]|nr:hypothetical protein [Spirochaetota bacterium]